MSNNRPATNRLTLKQAKHIVLQDMPEAQHEGPATWLESNHYIKVGDDYFHARDTELEAWQYVAEIVVCGYLHRNNTKALRDPIVLKYAIQLNKEIATPAAA